MDNKGIIAHQFMECVYFPACIGFEKTWLLISSILVQFFSAFYWLPSLTKLHTTLVSFIKTKASYEVSLAPLIGKPHMTLISFLKTMESYEICRVDII